MRALEFIRNHVTFKLPYDFSYQMKTPLDPYGAYIIICDTVYLVKQGRRNRGRGCNARKPIDPPDFEGKEAKTYPSKAVFSTFLRPCLRGDNF